MKSFLFISTVCISLICFSSGWAAPSVSGLSIVLPPDKSSVESSVISVVLNGWQTMVDEITISVNNRKQDVTTKKFERYDMCYDGIRLSYGVNNITITGFKNGRKVHELTTRVFFRSDLSPSASNAPDGFKQYLFHTGENEKKCSPCHELNFRNSGDRQQGPDQSPCYVCHKKILSGYKFVHGPAAVWSCLMCHDGKSKNPKLAVASPVSQFCANCHENSWDSGKYLHAPTAAGSCTACHNPHAADKPYFLRMSAGNLCLSCHEEIPTRPHVISSFSSERGHPLKGRPDPLKPGEDLTCTSCHNPHGGNSSVFLNGYDEAKKPIKFFCMSCHKW